MMKDLMNVISIEWMKLIHKKRLWITLILGVVFVIGLSALGYLDGQYDGIKVTKQQIKYQEQNLARIQAGKEKPQNKKELVQELKQQLKEMQQLQSGNWRPISEKQLQNYKDREKENQLDAYGKTEMVKLQYHLEHNVRLLPDWTTTGYQQTKDLMTYTSAIFLPMLVVVLIADILSGETTSGTIKLLLVRPISRTTILFGKWIVSLLATIFLSLSFLFALWGANLAFYGTKGAFQPIVVGLRYTFKEKLVNGINQLQTIPHMDHAAVLPVYQF
ncbi:ABC-2 type transport system permease protein [Pullulanibacillus pueri]|uniref:ABC transporter permease n=1 Tax=Pullulanibacillus pueri TaxID=1437324 RepID=A0A8J3EN81_9BACL|nr:ABC transporter permease subunit [Pullulanibacillus pueri]MBM7683691.1 ABC-2 type transport system permease protein [Pullulanibacillus pueri]GGH87102.1 hypothetical protein GCM10007096_36340 [Pullulanibacillus pueri]